MGLAAELRGRFPADLIPFDTPLASNKQMALRKLTQLAVTGAVVLAASTILRPVSAQAAANYTYPYAVSTLAGSPVSTGSSFPLQTPSGIVSDGNGNFYVADHDGDQILKVTAQGVISVVAGATNIRGTTDGSVATARFNEPFGVAVDPSGNIYVADTGNSTIRLITPGGVVSTIAGGNATVQDGTGSAAGFNYPMGITYYGGNLYVADSSAGLIRKVTLAGVVTTLAGGGGGNGTDGTGAAASFGLPSAIAADSAGNLYVADKGDEKVRKVELDGTVTSFAGSGGDSVNGVAVDGSGNVFFATALEVHEIHSGSSISTVAGASVRGSNDGPGPASHFYLIEGLAVDGSGNVFISDAGNHLIRELSTAGTVTTLAGADASVGAADGQGAAARFNLPVGVTVDSNGNLYVIDSTNETVRKVTAGGTVTTLAGSPYVVGSTDGLGAAASFNFFQSTCYPAVDASGNVFVPDSQNDTIRKIAPDGTVTTFAGSAGNHGSADGQGTAAQFWYPLAIAMDPAGNLFVVDGNNETVRKITASGTVTTVAGQVGVAGHLDGAGSAATFWTLGGIACDRLGNLYVSDLPFIRKISPQGMVTTIAGTAPGYEDIDGPSTSAAFGAVGGLAADGYGNIFVSDWVNNNIRVIDLNGVVSTLAGATGPGILGGGSGSSDGLGAAASFFSPEGIAVDGAGNFYVADSGNNTIRKGAPTVPLPTASTAAPTPTPTPAPTPTPSPVGGLTPTPTPTPVPNRSPEIVATPQDQSADIGAAAAFWVGATGSPPLSYQWSFNGSSIPGATSALYMIADVQQGTAGTYTVTVSNSLGHVTSIAAQLIARGAGAGTPPTLGSPPASQTTASGGTVVFTAELGSAAAGSSTSSGLAVRATSSATFQWFLDGSPVSGANAATYVISPVTAADNGSYACLIQNPDGSVLTTPATLNVVVTTDVGRLANISCRAGAGTGSATLITGFVLGGGSGATTEQLLVRGSGPALVPFGVTGTLPDPELKLFHGNSDGSSTLLGTNDGWTGNALIATTASGVGAFPWAISSSHDSALVLDLAAGTYTAQIAGESGDSGVALAEVYDAPVGGSRVATAPRLINISARVQVGTAANILISGFVIDGSTSATVLVRASGPALKAFSVTGTLADPKLQLYRTNADGSSTLLASDTGWGGDPQILAAAAFVGAFSWGTAASADSALFVTLPPGAYTAQVAGASGDTGVALIEVYLVP